MSDMNDVKLYEGIEVKPCPFCGNDSGIDLDMIEEFIVEIKCPDCDLRTYSKPDNTELKKQAIKKWNTRTPVEE